MKKQSKETIQHQIQAIMQDKSLTNEQKLEKLKEPNLKYKKLSK